MFVFGLWLLWSLTFISFTKSQECNEVTLSVVVPLVQKNLGSFSVSTGRCQAMKFLVPEFKFEVQMSFFFECDGNDLKASVYDDLYCEQINGDPYHVDKNDDISILNGLAKMTIDSLACNKYDCYGEFKYSQNCSSNLSPTYISVSFPFGQCLPLSVLDNNDNEDGGRLNGKAVQFHCCKKTYDLLLFNYSSSTCLDDPTVYRFDSKYNDKCFKVMRENENNNENDNNNNNGIGSMLYDLNRRFLQEESNNGEHQEGVFIFSYECPKNNLIDCTNIDVVSDENFPDECASTCKDKLQSNDDTNNNGSGDSKSGNNGKNSKSSKNVTVLSTLFAGIVVVLIIILVSIFRKNKKLKKELKNEQEVVIGKEKYEPMIEESGPNVNNVESDNFRSDIVLPTNDNVEGFEEPHETEIVTTNDE